MEPPDDIIDALYRCRDPSSGPTEQDTPPRTGNAVFAISPASANHTNQYYNHTPNHYNHYNHTPNHYNHTPSHYNNNHQYANQPNHSYQPGNHGSAGYNHPSPGGLNNHTSGGGLSNHHSLGGFKSHSPGGLNHHTSPGGLSQASPGGLGRRGHSESSPNCSNSGRLRESQEETSRWSVVRGHSSTPVLGRYNAAGGTGRIGYNNTPQVRRRASFTRSGSHPSTFEHQASPLPRSASAFDYRSPPGPHHRAAEPGLAVEEDEPVYVPRSTMVDIIYRGQDELLGERHRTEELVELPSGARQRRTRVVEGEGGAGMSEGSELRRRAGRGERAAPPAPERASARPPAPSPGQEETGNLLLAGANKVLGLLVMLYLAYRFSLYLLTLHDNELWFSEIMEVEREISFRTEQGLYYSYYKQLLAAPSLAEGLHHLQHDNTTESGNTINILHRFNVHQEVVLAALYSLYSFRLAPIFFYTYAVFALQGLFLCALFLTSWSLTGTWVTGVLTAVYAVVNRFDVTRVTFTVPLREHFSLPFIFAQFYCVGRYLAARREGSEGLHLGTIYLTTLLFTLAWQFSQFVLLIQAVVVFGLATLGVLDRDRVCRLLCLHLASMLSVWYLQAFQPMVLNSLVVSLAPIAILSLQSQSEPPGTGVGRNLGLAVGRVGVAAVVTVCLNIIIKVWMDQTADSHIFKFLRNKLSRDSTDFESQLYLCNEAFKWLDWSTYQRLTTSSALPAYLSLLLLSLLATLRSTLRRWSSPTPPPPPPRAEGAPPHLTTRSSSRALLHQQREQEREEERRRREEEQHLLPSLASRPDLTFHVAQSLPLGLLAASTLRMKCFWSPYICLLASVALSDPSLWTSLVARVSGGANRRVMNFTRHLVLLSAILLLTSHHRPVYQKEMEDLREFYDPDTVDLMQWIQQNSAPSDAFSGSMQLLAGVKLCTGRTLTNHPHFEDKALRDRTKELYQMYAKAPPAEVHSILTKYNASYVILEDSICLAHRERCSTPDIMDLSNGHIPEDGIRQPPHLVASKHPRFCDEVRYDTEEYRKYFRKVFENKTFRIYKLVKKGEV